MNPLFMILAFALGAVGAVMIVAAFAGSLNKNQRNSMWVKWVRRIGLAMMVLAFIFMVVMTFVIGPALVKAA